MNSKGFTLIELTAVVLILAIIFLVSFPSLLSLTKSDKDQEYDKMVENLCLAGKSYIYDNEEEYQELLSVVNSEIKINISDLIDSELVSSKTLNVKTDKLVDKDTLTFTVLSDYSLECEYNG